MGDARRRQLALAAGQPWPEDLHRCPNCHSRRTAAAPGQPMALSVIPTLYGTCAECKTFWEAFPPGWSHDVCEGEPCDNCAFRADSPEASDRAGWKGLLAKLKAGQEFKCHKGAPILLDLEANTAEVRDACLIGDDDGITVTSEPTIDESLFDRICAALSAPTASPADRPALPRDASLQPPGGLK